MDCRNLLRMVGSAVAVAVAAGVLVAAPAAAHQERDAEFPDGSGEVPAYRPPLSEPYLVVCKSDSDTRIARISDPRVRALNRRLLSQCRFDHIQDAVNTLQRPGSTIYVLPGIYEEEPYRKMPECAEAYEDRQILSYEEQLRCPQAQNLIGVFGDVHPGDDERLCDGPACNLQIEGTGDDPEDVVIRGGFNEDKDWIKLNGIRGDRADGLYLKNFTIELFEFNAIYVLETDGFMIDQVVARKNDEYGYLTFAVDHGVHKDCEAYLNGEAGVYPGSASDVNRDSDKTGRLERWAVEIRDCSFHHNALGMAGTAGNSLLLRDNDFFNNSAGITVDSFYPNHPGLPQDHGWFVDNRVYSNNENYFEKFVYSGKCDAPPAERGYEKGTVCPVVPAPVGTGVLVAGGSYNYLEKNVVYDNWRAGFMMFGIPSALREEFDPSKQFDTSNFNHYVGNVVGLTPTGEEKPNGLDFWWDDQGEGNCWEENDAGDGEVTSNTMYPGGLPDCASGGSSFIPLNAYKQGPLVPCAFYDRDDPIMRQPPGCDWMTTPDEP